MSHPVAAEPVLARTVSALRQGLGERLVAVVLFGSRARGDASPDSDWDLLVIARDLPDSPFERHTMLKQVLPSPERGSLSIMARTPEEFDGHVSSLYLDVALDGLVLYDPESLADKHLSRLRRHIERLGIVREREGRDFVWRRLPGRPFALGDWESLSATGTS